jgi:hypothetical protein
METKRVKTFRVRQRVRSASEPELVFVIERSSLPDRIYYGADRWWTKNEIQALGEPENPDTSLRLNGIEKMRAQCAQCAQGISGEPESVSGLPKAACLTCGGIFEPVRPWQRFDSEDCRRNYWKRNRKEAQTRKASAAEKGSALPLAAAPMIQ